LAWWSAAAVIGLPVAAVAGVAAGLAVAAYAVTTVVIARRRLRERAGAWARAAAIDAVVGLAVGPALAAAAPAMSQVDGARPVAVRVAAAVQLAEATGAPLADVLDRLDADLRAADRVRATAMAQLAGARASSWLLTVMPLAGIGLGHAIGADPLRILLRTPLGAGCLLGAVALQLAGLAWADRLARVEVAS
jgi:tight adherence protein B